MYSSCVYSSCVYSRLSLGYIASFQSRFTNHRFGLRPPPPIFFIFVWFFMKVFNLLVFSAWSVLSVPKYSTVSPSMNKNPSLNMKLSA